MEQENKPNLGPKCPICGRNFRTQEGADKCKTLYKEIDGWICRPQRNGSRD